MSTRSRGGVSKLLGIAALGAVVIVPVALYAQTAPQHGHGGGHKAGHGQMAGQSGKSRSINEAASAYEAVNAKMHKDMAITYTGDADVDFLKGMIPHHRGAVDMAQVVLKYGKDPEVRKLAEEIIASQSKEIVWMNGWLSKSRKP